MTVVVDPAVETWAIAKLLVMPDNRTRRAEDDSRLEHLPMDLECWVALGFVVRMMFEPELAVETSK